MNNNNKVVNPSDKFTREQICSYLEENLDAQFSTLSREDDMAKICKIAGKIAILDKLLKAFRTYDPDTLTAFTK